MAQSQIRSGKRRYPLWLAGAFISACTGIGLETPSDGAPAEPKKPEGQQVAMPAPYPELPDESDEPDDSDDVDEQAPPEPDSHVDDAPQTDDEPNEVCRAVVRRGDEVVLIFASGEERLLDRNAMWQRTLGQVWALGEHAIVGVPETEDFVARPPFAAFALVHAADGVLWRGTAPAGDYIRATGFRSLTREGYVVLNDSRVLDPTGAEHGPLEDFLPVGDSIDEDGFILVAREGELAYWNVRADALDVSVTAEIGTAIMPPTQLGGVEGHDAAFIEENAGTLSFTRVSRGDMARATLNAELTDRLRERFPARGEDFGAVAVRELNDAALLVVDHRPAAWAGAGEAPHAFDAWSTLPPSRDVQAAGGCFAGAPRAASTAEELIAGLWRVHTGSGALEMGLRFALPTGLRLEIPDPSEPGYTFPVPVCATAGRMAVLLSGPEGFAWFAEGDSSFERITDWGERTSLYPLEYVAPGAGQTRRIIGPFEWLPSSDAGNCELRYNDDGVLRVIDHARALELLLAPDANAALLGE